MLLLYLLSIISSAAEAGKKTAENTADYINEENLINNRLNWNIFFSTFFMQSSSGKKSSRVKNNDTVTAVREFRVGPTIRRRFIEVEDRGISIVIPEIVNVLDISVIKLPLDIEAPELVELPDIDFSGIKTLEIDDIDISKDITVTVQNENVTPKVYSAIVIPTLSLR